MKKSVLVLVAAVFLCGVSLRAQSSAGGQKDKSAQAQPAGKRPPQAKTHQEYEDYNTAYAVSGGAAVRSLTPPSSCTVADGSTAVSRTA